VASMYDASLDAFVPHDWLFNIYNSYYMKLNFQPGSGFSAIHSANYSKDWNIIFPTQFRRYDELNWFDASIGYSSGRASGAGAAYNITLNAPVRQGEYAE